MNEPASWTEDDSATYRRLAPIAVPARAEQLAAVSTLVPFTEEDDFKVVEVGSGEGVLAGTVALSHPRARVVALDGSSSMRASSARRLERLGVENTVAPFDLASDEWLRHVEGAGAVVSSLVIHHVGDEAKRRIFGEVAPRLAANGALVIADIVAPTAAPSKELFSATWDAEARAQAAGGDVDELFELFERTEWNVFRYPDAMDVPSSLRAQLRWLTEAGLNHADCFWLRGGHAIYGGYRSSDPPPGVAYETALEAAERALTGS
jgi:tRNA (cmo5U34)-methyltransferase